MNPQGTQTLLKEDVISTFEFVYQVNVTGIAIAVHEAGHALLAVREGVDFLKLDLNPDGDAEQGPLLAQLLLSAEGLDKINNDDQLAMRLSQAGPVAEFCYLDGLNGGLPLDQFYDCAYGPTGGWKDDVEQMAKTLFPGRSTVIPNELKTEVLAQIGSACVKFTENGDLEILLKIADAAFKSKEGILTQDEIKAILS